MINLIAEFIGICYFSRPEFIKITLSRFTKAWDEERRREDKEVKGRGRGREEAGHTHKSKLKLEQHVSKLICIHLLKGIETLFPLW